MGGKSGSKRKSQKSKEVPQEDNYRVEKIVGDRIIKGKTQYKIHWAGYTTDEETWENESQLDCNELLDEYLADNAGEGEASREEQPGGNKEKRSHGDESSDEEDASPKKRSSRGRERPASGDESSDEESSVSPKKKTSRGRERPASGDESSDEESSVSPKKRSSRGREKPASGGESSDEEGAASSKKARSSRGNPPQTPPTPHDSDEEITVKSTKNKKSNSSNKKSNSGSSRKFKPGPVNGENEYEVERIIDMHTLKSGKREFLVHWKGFGKGDETWEPEEHLTCTSLLEKFLQRVEKAKEIPAKELRMDRRPTDRFTAMPQGDKRRQSKRHANQQRVKYYEAE